jgi:hypothetical protein
MYTYENALVYANMTVQIYNSAGTGTLRRTSIHCSIFTTAAGGSGCKIWVRCFRSSGICPIYTFSRFFNPVTCAKFSTTSCCGWIKSSIISTADWGCSISFWHHSYTNWICGNTDTSTWPNTETCHHSYSTGLWHLISICGWIGCLMSKQFFISFVHFLVT